MVVPLEDVDFVGCGWDGDPDAFLWPLDPSRPYIGLIGLRSVTMRNCRLTRIGLAGTPEFIAEARDDLLGR